MNGSLVDHSMYSLVTTAPHCLILTRGSMQGLVLGRVLYAIYVSPLFDLTQLTNFADDNYYLEWTRALL